jgi:glycolate oxidase
MQASVSATPTPNTLPTALLQQLRQFAKANGLTLLTTPAERLAYECDACVLLPHQPQAIALPTTTAQVQALVRWANQHNVPWVARGAGTGLSGGALAVAGGLLIALNKLTAIGTIDVAKRCVWVEAGVVNAKLNQQLAPLGLYYAPDPSSMAACTLGGNVAENAGGIHCFKHGVTTDHILGLKGVWPGGASFTLGSASAYGTAVGEQWAWQRLLTGSEGTLGIVTEALLRLSPAPTCTHLIQAVYTNASNAANAVSTLIKQGQQPAAIEFLDGTTIWAVNQAYGMGFPPNSEALLLVECSGLPSEVPREIEAAKAVLAAFHPSVLKVATTHADCQTLWKARKGTVAAYGRLHPAFYVHDCVIPRSQLANVLAGITAIGHRYGIPIANVFHAGDGNLHPNLLFDPKVAGKTQQVIEAGEAILALCLSVGGTLSGEHGIGLEKLGFMHQQFTPADLEPMHWVRVVADPKGLANPGKLLPAKGCCGGERMVLSHEMKLPTPPSPQGLLTDTPDLWI